MVTPLVTEDRFGATPILDREAPLPPRKPPGSGLAPLFVAWIGAFLLIGACWFADSPPMLRQGLRIVRPWLLDHWARIGFFGFALSLIAAFYLMLAVHEFGHLFAGLCVGFRCRSLRVGPLLFTSPLGITLHRGPGSFVNGVADLVPVKTDKLALRGVVMVLGGPVANFFSALIVLLLPFPITVFSGFFVACSIANGVNDLFPFASRLGVSDGARIWMLLWRPDLGERWLALLHLGGQLHDGVPPESLSPDFLTKALAVRDASEDTVKANGIAFSVALHSHKDGEAAERLETCLAFSSYATPGVREALMSDAAVFQARRRNRADLAAQWLSEIPTSTPTSWLRLRAEAAVLEVQGDVQGAIDKLAEVESLLVKVPNSGQRETLLRSVQRWKADLE
jgi:hypothetical protein